MTSRTLVTGTGTGTEARNQGRAAILSRLVERVAAEDPSAFEELYRRTAGSVHALVRRVLTEDAPSAEVTAEVYVRVWSTARGYDRSRHTAENWLLDLAHRSAVERRRGSTAQDTIMPAPSAGSACSSAVGLITPEQAEALELTYFCGATHAESARVLGVDRATFRIRVRTALSRLRQDLDSGRTSGPNGG